MALLGLFGKKNEKAAAREAEIPVETKVEAISKDVKIDEYVADLNRESVIQLVKACRLTEKSREAYEISLEQTAFGYSKNSLPLAFDADVLDEHSTIIGYLYGQLQTTHNDLHAVPLKDILKKYDGSYWANEKNAPLYFLHLLIGAGILLPPTADTKQCLIMKEMPPTLSPEDSGFSEWYPKYKKLKAEGADVREYHKILPKR